MELNQTSVVQTGGILTVLPQLIYLDFDGELTSYNGEILTVDNVTVEDSCLTAERIARITQALNERFAGQNVLFVSDKSDLSDQSDYSTIYIGKTSSFEPYGTFAGLAETVDYGNKIRNDNAFVMLDSLSSNESIADVIAHEAGHLLGTLDHDGEGLEKYAYTNYYNCTYTGTLSSSLSLNHYSSDYYRSGTVDPVSYYYDKATNVVLTSGANLYIGDGSATNMTLQSGAYVSGTGWGYLGHFGGSAAVIDSATETSLANISGFSGYGIFSVAGSAQGVYLQFHRYNNQESMTLLSGAVAENTKLGYYTNLIVQNGGRAENTIFSEYAWAYILSGGTANSTTIQSGNLYVNGGTASNTKVTCGNVYISSGGIVNDITLSGSKANLYIGDGSATNMTLQSGAYVSGTGWGYLGHFGGSAAVIDSATETSLANISGFSGYGIFSVAGSAQGVYLQFHRYNNQESMTLLSGAVAENTKLGYYTNLIVQNGGRAENTIFSEYAWAYILSGGTANSTTIQSGNLYVNGGTASNTKVTCGNVYISSGGIVNDITLSGSKANLYIGDGSATNMTLQSGAYVSGTGWGDLRHCGGSAAVIDSATETSLANISGFRGYGIFSVAGSAKDISLYYLYTGGGASMTLLSGAVAENTTLEYLGNLIVENGGRAEKTTMVGYYASFYVSGTANSTTVSNGFMYVCGGGRANNTAVSSGGRMYVSSGGTVAGSLQIASGAVVSAYQGAIIDFTVADQTDSSKALINDWSLIDGGVNANYTVTVRANQAAGTYALADGAAEFNKTVTVKTVDNTELGTLAVGETKEFGGVGYTLAKDAGTLELTIGSVVIDAAKGDLDGNGLADVVMTIDQSTHPYNGATGAWLIQEDQTPVWGDLSTRNEGWSIFGTGWTSAKATADVYIKSTGNIVGAWVTDSQGKVSGWETIGDFGADAQVLGLGDFNGDGQSDILLRNANGAVGCYFTSGEGWNYFQSLGDEWKICGIGDLNGDGRDDVVLKHDAGFAGTWLTQSDGTIAWADLDTLSTGFEIVGCGDFNDDGVDDVLLQNGSYFGAWIVENGSVSGWMGLGTAAGTVEQIADFDGDGTDDLRVRSSDGAIGSLLVKGADTLEWKYYGSVGDEWSTSLASLQ